MIGVSVVPAVPPPPPIPPVIPPSYENSTDEDGDPLIIDTVPAPVVPTLVVVRNSDETSVDFIVPVEMQVTMEPHSQVHSFALHRHHVLHKQLLLFQQTGHLVHVAVTIFDSDGQPVVNLGLVNPWMCEASLLLSKDEAGR